MFMGEYQHNLDDKSRLVIPSVFRASLGNDFVITRGLEKCLYIYSKSEWNKIVAKLDTLPFTKKDVRTFIRGFFSGANSCTLDKSGRVVLAPYLLEYANITKDCIIIGANDRIEIWDRQNWNEFMNENANKLSDIAENLFMENI